MSIVGLCARVCVCACACLKLYVHSAILLSVVMLFCVRNCCFYSLRRNSLGSGCLQFTPEEEFCLPLIQGEITPVGRSDAEKAREVTWLGSQGMVAITLPDVAGFAVISSLLSQHSVTAHLPSWQRLRSPVKQSTGFARGSVCDLSRFPQCQRQRHLLFTQTLKELSSAALAPLKNTQQSRNQHSQWDF